VIAPFAAAKMGARQLSQLAVHRVDGRYVYATFDAGVTGTGGVAVVDSQTGQKLASWSYPGAGRPHGIAYSTVAVSLP
jgi:hypothetical protein